uniref:general transcription factor IIF subunit 2-like n=1 Tax=Styela clava TaxID=7725 RepID=UPI00193AB054|nr:general transcription factor IIF subunit 2-like [Styela clava]
MADKEEDNAELDCTGAKHSVWLVKVPKYLATIWKEAPGGQPVGKLRIGKTMGRTQVSFNLDESLAKEHPTSKDSVPTEHKFSLQGMGNQSLAVFSQIPGVGPGGSEKRAIEGRIVQKADCMPQGGQKYMKLKMTQFVVATKPTRTVKQLDTAVRSVYKPVSRIQEEIANDKRQKAEGKRIRGSKEQVMAKLFEAFEKHQFYSIQDLGKITKQPITFLKEILREIGHYNLKNPHKNMWELKPEYRHHETPKMDVDSD